MARLASLYDVGHPPSGSVPARRSSGDITTVFGSCSKNKALCACGSIADLDSKAVGTKRRLGKRIECVTCRNKRIAREHEMLERHFLGMDDEEEK